MAIPRVTLYSGPGCAYCKQARDWLKANGVKFQEFDVQRSAKGRAALQRLGLRGVPVILVGDEVVDGFRPKRLRQLLAR